MKKLIAAAFLLIVPIFFICAEKNYTNEMVVFLPQEFFVGDLVEMRVVVKPAEGVKVLKPERFPDSYWVKIEYAEVIELDGKYELRVLLRSYAPGIRTLPSLQFGDVLLRDLRIQTKSVLDDNPAGLSPPAEQMLLPGTKYYIAFITGIIFILPVFLIIFWGRLKGVVHGYFYNMRRKRPYKKLVKAVGELRAGMNETKGKAFYTELIDAMRVYFTARGSIDYTSATVREGVLGIATDFCKIDGHEQLIELFRLADEVKFGGRRVMIRKREEHLDIVEAAAEEIEKVLVAGGGNDVDL